MYRGRPRIGYCIRKRGINFAYSIHKYFWIKANLRSKLRTYFTLLLLICFSSTSIFGYTQYNNLLLNGADKIGLNKSNHHHSSSEVNETFSTVEELILENETEDNNEETFSDGDIHSYNDESDTLTLYSIDNQFKLGFQSVPLTILYCVFRL